MNLFRWSYKENATCHFLPIIDPPPICHVSSHENFVSFSRPQPYLFHLRWLMDDKNQQRNNPKEQDKSQVNKRLFFSHKSSLFRRLIRRKQDQIAAGLDLLQLFANCPSRQIFALWNYKQAFSPKLKPIFYWQWQHFAFLKWRTSSWS